MTFIRDKRLPPIGLDALKNVQLPPDFEQALTFYVSHAPERLPAPDTWPPVSESPVRFERRPMTMKDMPSTPAISNVQLVTFGDSKRLTLLGTDMRQGVVFTGDPANPDAGLTVLANAQHPARATLTDVDGDGIQDVLVGDLGEFFPADHHKGSIIYLRGLPSGKYGAIWLDGWPRVADVEAADFNGDGRKDLLVAAFGWHTTGQIAILESQPNDKTALAFATHVIDPRPGAIHVIPVDLNGDKKMDFVALLAQEHETVIAYINKGDFAFDRQIIYAAPHPNWGSSGIQLVDLDRDGDLDVLLTHGDTFDDGIVKPYHGIQWLENKGTYPFVEHTLARIPGVHRAVAADINGDGLLDIVACALLAAGSDVDETILPALVWLEQTKSRTFVRHTIEMGTPRHATLDVGDIDGDGDIDIVTGTFLLNKETPNWVDVWVNRSR
jgi:FG-GAP-like repeat